MILHRGRSRLTKAKEWFTVVLTGLDKKSNNGKTGEMCQTWILPDKKISLKSKERELANKEIVCGDCELLKINACYVLTVFAPNQVQKALAKGNYPKLDLSKLVGKCIRWGSWGDPSIIPLSLINKINKKAKMFTGYTHQHTKKWAQKYKSVFMASCTSLAQKEIANKNSWRTFRVVKSLDEMTYDEIECPASKEYKKRTGKIVNCQQCGLCCGTSSRSKKNIAITGHGGSAVGNNIMKLLEENERVA